MIALYHGSTVAAAGEEENEQHLSTPRRHAAEAEAEAEAEAIQGVQGEGEAEGVQGEGEGAKNEVGYKEGR